MLLNVIVLTDAGVTAKLTVSFESTVSEPGGCSKKISSLESLWKIYKNDLRRRYISYTVNMSFIVAATLKEDVHKLHICEYC